MDSFIPQIIILLFSEGQAFNPFQIPYAALQFHIAYVVSHLQPPSCVVPRLANRPRSEVKWSLGGEVPRSLGGSEMLGGQSLELFDPYPWFSNSTKRGF